jgi:hypothetical protein
MSRFRIAVVALTVALVSSCAASSSTGPSGPFMDLRVEFRADSRRDPQVATLRCGSDATATGFLAGRAEAVCESVAPQTTVLTQPADPTRPCTQIYGGPEIARVIGTVERQRVDREFTRADGCGIADWDKVKMLIDPRS